MQLENLIQNIPDLPFAKIAMMSSILRMVTKFITQDHIRNMLEDHILPCLFKHLFATPAKADTAPVGRLGTELLEL